MNIYFEPTIRKCNRVRNWTWDLPITRGTFYLRSYLSTTSWQSHSRIIRIIPSLVIIIKWESLKFDSWLNYIFALLVQKNYSAFNPSSFSLYIFFWNFICRQIIKRIGCFLLWLKTFCFQISLSKYTNNINNLVIKH